MLRLFACWEGLKHRLRDERGQGMVEYGLIIALVALGVIVALGLIGDELANIFDKIGSDLQSAQSQ
ncbi:MAG TPA: Flp family type IVb pilin [Thermaerobacter sp.]